VNWLPFTGTNLPANLDSTDGIYAVTGGLKGFSPEATETWRSYAFYPDRVAKVAMAAAIKLASAAFNR
jgi:hypothetical protein